MKKPKDINEYIAGFPKEIQKLLEQVRATIKKEAPNAEETISYAIPTFILNNTYLIYFAAYKNHLSIYPVPKGDDHVKKEISLYKTGKGTLQFPYDKPIPFDFVRKIVRLRILENQEKAKVKK